MQEGFINACQLWFNTLLNLVSNIVLKCDYIAILRARIALINHEQIQIKQRNIRACLSCAYNNDVTQNVGLINYFRVSRAM